MITPCANLVLLGKRLETISLINPKRTVLDYKKKNDINERKMMRV